MTLQQQIDLYLSKCLDGEGTMSDEILDRFAERCKETMKLQFNEGPRDFKISMSSVGKPLCQQQMDKKGAKRERPPASLKMKMAYGYLVENLIMAVLEAADVNIESVQEKVEYKLNGTTIKGTLDVVVDGKVYDIKSASKYAYDRKFSKENGFEIIKADDPFGYIPQGYLYGAGAGKPFGGWIAFNKETGGIAVCETPRNGEELKKAVIKNVEKTAHALENDEPFKRCFKPTPELFRKQHTGDYVLHVNCSYCQFKHPCWGDEITFRKSKKAASHKWFFGG
jgi:hypothetical protein